MGHYLSKLNTGDIDLDQIIALTDRFRPADIEYMFQKVAQLAFELEYTSRQDYRVTTETFVEVIAQIPPSLTDEIIEELRQDSVTYSRS